MLTPTEFNEFGRLVVAYRDNPHAEEVIRAKFFNLSPDAFVAAKKIAEDWEALDG